jgi:hypothetical protein
MDNLISIVLVWRNGVTKLLLGGLLNQILLVICIPTKLITFVDTIDEND